MNHLIYNFINYFIENNISIIFKKERLRKSNFYS